jgi:hypothetical protein
LLQIVLTSLRESFVGPFLRFCDGDWHSLEVVQTKEKIHFRLDEFSKVVAIPDDSEVQKITIGSISKGN